ncbi:MAG TPA: hypothetical protein VJN93_17185 [Candidatus Acidoferrum sp.]|nr:hypothetical protein [Candidatus Acidoferrum sp.]
MQPANKYEILCTLVVALLPSGCNTSHPPKYALNGPLSQAVSDYEESGHQFDATVWNLAEKYRLKVGMDLEIVPRQKLISVNLHQGNVADVLNAIVAQERGYSWEETDGTVNIRPRRNANSLLSLRIAHFEVRNTNFDDLNRTILLLPEVKNWSEAQHLTERSRGTVIATLVSPGQPLKPLVSLDLHDVTLLDILNRLTSCPGYYFWEVLRYGDNNQYLTIDIS